VDAIIATTLERVRAHNAHPDRLTRVTSVLLFGSALEPGRDSYGDVDIFLERTRRRLDPIERARIEALIRPRMSASLRQSMFGQIMGESMQEDRELLRDLLRGQRHLSLSRNSPAQHGFAHAPLLAHDLDSDRELPVDPAIVPAALVVPGDGAGAGCPEPGAGHDLAHDAAPDAEIGPIPAESAIAPKGLPADTVAIKLAAGYLPPDVMARIEGRAWEGEWTGAHLKPRKLVGDARFAGAQHLCPVWKEPGSGAWLLARALAWADEHKLRIARAPRSGSLALGWRQREAAFGDEVQVRRVSDRIEGDLFFSSRISAGGVVLSGVLKVSRLEVAARYAVAAALGRMIDEVKLGGAVPTFELAFDLPEDPCVDDAPLPDFRPLVRGLRQLAVRVPFSEKAIRHARKLSAGGWSVAVTRSAGVT
jgi:hypothetical protein